MERLFFRARHAEDEGRKTAEIQSRGQLNIAVTGLGRGVGTTFVGTALAFYFRDQGKTVSFCQCLTPSKAARLLFDEVSMEQRFVRRTFCEVYEKIIAGEPIGELNIGGKNDGRKRLNVEEGISWILPTGRETRDFTEARRARLLTIPRGEVCIFDFEADDQWNPFLLDMDLIVVTVDPLPSRLIHDKARFRFLKKLELSGCPVIWAVNRINEGVSLRQVKSYLKTNQMVCIPAFSIETIYQCEYACRFPWENSGIRRKIVEIFTKVSQFKASL